jgi:toxin ParE1/3/4
LGFLRFSREAKTDLLDIWLWIARDSIETADRILAELEQRAAQLRDNPQLGPARPDIHPEARSLVFERWLILYIQVDGGVLVVRIVDGARDLAKVL